MARTAIICKRHNYRDVPFYRLSGDVPECGQCIAEAEQEAEQWAAFMERVSQCNTCQSGADCYRHGYVDSEPELTADEQLAARLRVTVLHGHVYGGITIESPDYCDGLVVPF